jgi:UDP-glucose 4-epimerase
MNILVTGCNGFVGSALVNYLASMSDFHVAGVCRDEGYSAGCDAKIIYISDLELLDHQSDILQSTDVVIHAAGKAHVMEKNNSNDEKDYFQVNAHLTAELARMAASYGVKRFIYLSSTKVFGDPVPPVACFTSGSPTNPTDVYGESKLQAERKLAAVAKETGLEVVVIRPPLVYGQGVKGNMAMLSKLVRSNLPLPFRAVSANRRSMVSIENLSDLVRNCLSNPDANGQTFLVSDDHDLSTYAIICLFKKYLGSKSIVFSVPESMLHVIGRITGSTSKINRLIESSMVDIQHTKSTLKWSPPQSVEKAFEKMVK